MRRARILQEGARYHVTARAHRREMVFEEVTAKHQFMRIVALAKEKYGFQLENFCLMGNHFHMIIRPTSGTSLSTILQWILSAFSRYWNRIHGFTGQGAVWGQRFYSKVLATIAEFMNAFDYIDRNPVVGGLVALPEDWPFGGPGLRFRKALSPLWLDDPPEDLRSR